MTSLREPINARWWDDALAEAERAACIVDVATQIRQQQTWRQQGYEQHAELYAGGTVAASLHPGVRAGYEYQMSQIPHNVVRQCVDSMTARTCKTRPLPIVQASAGSWSDYKRAMKASQFLEGEEYRQRFFARIRPAWVRDAGVFGSGFLCVRRQRKSIVTERVLPTELFVDEWDAQHGDPQNMYRVRDIDRGVAIARFAKDADGGIDEELRRVILAASRVVLPGDEDNGMSSTVDRVTVVEAFHLCADTDMHAPTVSKEDRDAHAEECTGRYTVACNTGQLADAPWRRGYFPFPKLDFSPPFGGYYGQGLAEQLEGYQYEINTSEDRIQEDMWLSPGTLLITDGQIPETHITNGSFPIVKGTPGARLDAVQVQPVNEQWFRRQESLIVHSYRESGQTTLGVAGEKPIGINSGAGLREIEDQESGRHVVLFRADEEACREWARQVIDCAKEIAEEYGDAEVSVPMSDGILKLKWSDCDLETYEVRVFSGSMLPQQKTARVDTLLDWMDRGIIDRATFLQQIEAADLKGYVDVDIAQRTIVDEQIEAMLMSDDPTNEDEYLPPVAVGDLVWAEKRARQKIMWAMLRKAPQANLALLTRYVDDCARLNAEANAGAAAMSAPAGAVPPPAAMAPPVAQGMVPPGPAPDAGMMGPAPAPPMGPPIVGNA